MKIVTGRTGTPHITSDDDRANNAGTYGKNYYVLNINDCLSAEIISANEVKLNSGELMLQGTHARIEYGDSETVTIADGESGYKRIDLIVARYIKSSGFERVYNLRLLRVLRQKIIRQFQIDNQQIYYMEHPLMKCLYTKL